MACQRNRISEITSYFKTLGIDVNIGKTKARGNRGIFLCSKGKYRIDIAKDIPQDKILPILVHEFAHFVHYCYDSQMKTLDFIFDDLQDRNMEELINITVDRIPKSSAADLYNMKESLGINIKDLVSIIKASYPDFKLSSPYKNIEKTLKTPEKYLLKYDKILFFGRTYTTESLTKDFPNLTEEQKAYILLKSKRRALARINSRISKLNKYYNKPSELFARFSEVYFLEPDKANRLAPGLFNKINKKLNSNKIPELANLEKILNQQ